MFRITEHRGVDRVVLKLEGRLSAPWVKELDTCWREATKALDGRPMWVDLNDVCFVDDAGRQLLALMYRAHVRFVARGCLMPEVVREISEAR
jgi:anti-anti-sigma regulatory factor